MGIDKTLAIVVLAVAALPIAGCNQGNMEGGPTPARVAKELEALKSAPASARAAAPAAPVEAVEVSAAARAEADQLFSTRCAACHGPTGTGEGPTAAALVPKPRNFHDHGWQSSVTDTHIEKIIIAGGPSVGKSPLMPPNPDLQGKAPVVTALREKIRAFGK